MRGELCALTPTSSLSPALSLTLALTWCVVNWTPEAEVGASGESPTDHSQLCTLVRGRPRVGVRGWIRGRRRG